LGITGASLSGHQIIAISTLLVTAVVVAAELWIAKRRDDLVGKIVRRRDVDPAVVHALIVYEAVRNGSLSSEDTVRLLRPEPRELNQQQQGLRSQVLPAAVRCLLEAVGEGRVAAAGARGADGRGEGPA
jgi:hypothetical protein